jgi:hypothetical protein
MNPVNPRNIKSIWYGLKRVYDYAHCPLRILLAFEHLLTNHIFFNLWINLVSRAGPSRKTEGSAADSYLWNAMTS